MIGKVDQKRQNERDLDASVNEPCNDMVLWNYHLSMRHEHSVKEFTASVEETTT